MLAPAIKRHFSDIVAVEEKMNGHNVRVLSIDGEIVALTRGGFICPYSTEVAQRLLPEEIFQETSESGFMRRDGWPGEPLCP